MAKLRHLAILTHQPAKMADYYKRVFDMQEMYKTKNGSVHLSDGEVNLAILNANDPKEPGHPAGLYHFGFHIDDAQETTKRIMDVYPEGAPKDRDRDLRRRAGQRSRWQLDRHLDDGLGPGSPQRSVIAAGAHAADYLLAYLSAA